MKHRLAKPSITTLENRLCPSTMDLVGLHFHPVIQSGGAPALVLQESQGSLSQAQLDQVATDNADGDAPILFSTPGDSTAVAGTFTDPRPSGIMFSSYAGMYATSVGMMNAAPHDDPDPWGAPVDGFYAASNSLLSFVYQQAGLIYTPGEVADPPAAPSALQTAQQRADALMVDQLALTARAVNRAAEIARRGPLGDFIAILANEADAIMADGAKSKAIVKEWNSIKAAWGPTAFPPRVNRVHDADMGQFSASYTVSRDFAVQQVAVLAAQAIGYQAGGDYVSAAACNYLANRFSDAIAVWDAAHPQ